MAVIKYKNPKYTGGGSEPKYIVIPTLTMENDEVYVGTTEPAEGEKIWVNPSNGLAKYKNGESWEDLVPEVDLSNYLAKDNSVEYVPSEEYNPSTKGYVDDKWFDINALLSEGEKYSEPTDITEFVNSTYGSITNLRENILLHKQLYRSHVGNNVEVIAASPNLYHIIGKYGISSMHYGYIHYDLQANDDNTSITIYKVGVLSEIVDGDGTKALMDNGQYSSVVKSGDENILKVVELGTLTLNNGDNDNVSIINADKLLSIKNNEWFIIGGTFNTVQRRMYAYKFNSTTNAFIHYGNITSPDMIFITIKNVSSENNTCSIIYNADNLVGVSEVLTKTNTTAFTPTADYHPSTKKYVDDHITPLLNNINVLDRINIGTITLNEGNNVGVTISNADKFSAVKHNEYFIIEGNINTKNVFLFAYNDGGNIKAFRHYGGSGSYSSLDFIGLEISNISVDANTANIYFVNSIYATVEYVDNYNLMPKSGSQLVHSPSAGGFDKKYTIDESDGKFSKVTILGNDDLPYDSFIILNDLSAYDIGDIVYTNIYKEGNDTIKYTVVVASNNSFRINFELIECFYEGINSVTTLANLPITKRSIVATVTAATSLSLASDLELGQELYIRIYNNGSSAITQPIPNSGNFVSMNGTSVSIPSKSFIEMSIWCYESGKYSIRIGEIA